MQQTDKPMIIPTLRRKHFYFYLVLPGQKIRVYDSLRNDINFYISEIEHIYTLLDWKTAIRWCRPLIPQQKNEIDCGWLMLINIRLICESRKLDYTMKDLDHLKFSLRQELLNSKIRTDQSFVGE